LHRRKIEFGEGQGRTVLRGLGEEVIGVEGGVLGRPSTGLGVAGAVWGVVWRFYAQKNKKIRQANDT
jgi:hypothetical protein